MTHVCEVVELRVEGPMDDELMVRLQRQLKEALELHPPLLRVDLAACPDVHAECWSLLRAAGVRAREQGTVLAVRDEHEGPEAGLSG